MTTSRSAFFAPAWRDGQAERIAETWDLSWLLPMPTSARRCSDCAIEALDSTDDIGEHWQIVRTWRFFQRKTSTKAPWRCDVSTKCIRCSLVKVHGVAVPEEFYDAAVRKGLTETRIDWRQGYDLLAEAGYFTQED